MSDFELAKVYDPKQVENKWYQFWTEHGYFEADVNTSAPAYSIVIPPPNVTDKLHMGHAYNNTIQDILIRYHRMLGRTTLWLPGTDHAGIATQNVVEKRLRNEEKLTRHDLGREKFVQRVWQWKEKYGGIIIEQLKKMGCSCDWTRERFTMDEKLSRAVRTVFVQLYEKGLIYRGEYIINWCPRCHTALSDEEAIHHDQPGHLWYINYPIAASDAYIVVATTRPETMLGDTAVAVNPADERYQHLIGKTVILPILDREIPIIADAQVALEFGTGAVKVTPAHDPNDFEIGLRHHLPAINVMNGDGTMNANAGKYEGTERFECRQKIVQELQAKALLVKTETHAHAVAHCQRCDTILEPYLSKQWFVRMKSLAEPGLQVVADGRIQFHPAKWTKVYNNWMENIRDWCISRQLWWGHRIPVYYCQDCGEMLVAVEPPTQCTRCNGSQLVQDADVLDTWFSSWLWPFSTLGWPDTTAELTRFYPTDTLVTAPDIIFFWVARMIMAGLEFMGDIPFHHVYIHGVIRDSQGRKMSKSLGNGIDPLEMVEKYSADAVRFSLLMLSSEGQDINLAESSFEIGRNFSNKLWNAYRFLALNLDPETRVRIQTTEFEALVDLDQRAELADRWILSRFHDTLARLATAIDTFKLNDAISMLHSFFWREFCDWYLELIKARLYGNDPAARLFALQVALTVFRGTLKLMHPFMPFITEEIWHQLKSETEPPLIVAAWGKAQSQFVNAQAETELILLQEVIGAIRNIRGEMNVPPGKKAELVIKGTNIDRLSVIRQQQSYIESLARVEKIQIGAACPKPPFAASAVVQDLEIYVPLEGLIDISVERERLDREIKRLEQQLESQLKKMANPNFLNKAPQDVVVREQQKKSDWEISLEKLRRNRASLEA
ncbi:valine--tRNA ligase [candidate division KSB1 bacterium]|nr:valine--tRNA ligase [candidate division KSB1 bacterium]